MSRTLIDTEKRYSQIEKGALAAEFTTTRLQMYLPSTPKFQLATDHKPLLPLFNNPTAKLPPHIERLALKMQNLNFEMIHIRCKTNITDFLSRHPLPETGTDHLEKYVMATVQSEHAVVLDKIKEETTKGRELTIKFAEGMQTDKWIKTDQNRKPYFDLRAELYMADGLILRIDRIIPSESLRDKIIQIAHRHGHLGMSKTKEMLHRKYWFPAMNYRIDTVVSTCFDCQIATNTQHTEPAKMTNLSEIPWQTIEIYFCGPFPSKEYALVITNQYSRYPEVEFVFSTAIKPVRQKMKKSSSLREFKTIQSDNGPPFNSEDLKEFAVEMGFTHKKVTPRHPKAQGQVQGFNKLMNKTAAIARTEGVDLQAANYDMLQPYRETPHPATGTAPYE